MGKLYDRRRRKRRLVKYCFLCGHPKSRHRQNKKHPDGVCFACLAIQRAGGSVVRYG